MTATVMSPFTRRSAVTALALSAVPAILRGDSAYAQAQRNAPETKANTNAKSDAGQKSLYERLGGIFAIAAVVDHFSDALIKNPVVGQDSKNPQLREWHSNNLERLPGRVATNL